MSSKAKKPACNKVKNPCKFCLQQVTNKTGLQCQGACKKWAHFKCLNYTPGKISDIKAGIIKVTCPCPDCETSQLKEFLANPPYTCSNNACPANRLPKCESNECPKNKSGGKTKSKRPTSAAPITHYPACANTSCSNEVIPCASKDCVPSKQKVKKQKTSQPRVSPERPPTPPRTPKRGSSKDKLSSPCRDSKSCLDDLKKRPESGKKQKKEPQPKKPKVKKSPSMSMMSSGEVVNCKKPQCTSSDSKVGGPKNQASMVKALQEMCGTVGMLSIQLKDLMCKLQNLN